VSYTIKTNSGLGIGKSCLMKRLTSGEFKAEHDVTVGVEFTGYDIKVEDKIIRL
jgi:GTPase SAR1 family protein